MANALISQGRFIGPIIPDITIEEVEVSPALITRHPIELGADTSDHMVILQKQVTMRTAWSDSSHQTNGFVRLVYQALIALQEQREPFDVSTGKKLYQDMVIESLVLTTDEKSEFTLNVICGLKEVIITSTSGGGGLSSSAQADPAQTGPVQPTGPVNATPTPAPFTPPVAPPPIVQQLG